MATASVALLKIDLNLVTATLLHFNIQYVTLIHLQLVFLNVTTILLNCYN